MDGWVEADRILTAVIATDMAGWRLYFFCDFLLLLVLLFPVSDSYSIGFWMFNLT